MIFEEGGQYKKLLCPECGGDNIGESGLGSSMVHCFDKCMLHLSRNSCPVVVVTSPEEIQVLLKPAY